MMNIKEFKNGVLIIKRVMESEGELEVKRKLTYDSSLCFGCELCSSACPQNAIKVYPLAYMLVGRPRIKVEAEKCLLCGICSEICPSGAIKVDGARIRLKRLFFADFECEDCNICEEVCKWDAIVSVEKSKSELENSDSKSEGSKPEEKGRATKKWIEELCIFCGRCARECPDGKIFVEKPIAGEVIVSDECKFCGVCMDICPSGAITFDRKIVVDLESCIFCGACKNACPVKAIDVIRKEIKVEKASYPWFLKHEEAITSIKKV